jgi:hypothetical protein
VPTEYSADVVLNSPLLGYTTTGDPLIYIWTEDRVLLCHSPRPFHNAWDNRPRPQSEIRQLLLRTLDHLGPHIGANRAVAESILRDTE